MSVQHEEVIVSVVRAAHDEAWFRYWREGKTELRPRVVLDIIRKVRTRAGVDESKLPDELLELLKEARGAQGEHEMVRLVRLIETLKSVYLPQPTS